MGDHVELKELDQTIKPTDEAQPAAAEADFEDRTQFSDSLESWYHSTSFYSITNTGQGWMYYLIATTMLCLQIGTLIGFLIAQFTSAASAELLNEASFFNSGDSDTSGSISVQEQQEIISKATSFPINVYDHLALVFVAFIISLNIIRELQETFVTELFNKEHWTMENAQNCCHKGSARFLLILVWILNFARRYILVSFVLACSSIVMQGVHAKDILLNGLAIYSILEADNLLYEVLHNKNSKEVLQTKASVKFTLPDVRRMKFFAFAHGIACVIVIIWSASRTSNSSGLSAKWDLMLELALVIACAFSVAGIIADFLYLFMFERQHGLRMCGKLIVSIIKNIVQPWIACCTLIAIFYLSGYYVHSKEVVLKNAMINLLGCYYGKTTEGCSSVVDFYSSGGYYSESYADYSYSFSYSYSDYYGDSGYNTTTTTYTDTSGGY